MRLSLKERRTEYINATNLDRKSGGAQWRDLRFSDPFLEMFFETEGSRAFGPPKKIKNNAHE